MTNPSERPSPYQADTESAMMVSTVQEAAISAEDRGRLVESRAISVPGYGFCLAIIAVLIALPILTSANMPLFDYANHLSRAHVIATWDQSATFQAWFERSSFLIPNVMADLLLVGLTRLVEAEPAGRILLLLIHVLTLSGAVALGYARSGRLEVWPLFVAVLLYNEMFHWGFLNYLLGLGLLLWGLAAWTWFDERSRRLQLTSGAVFALLIFFSHLVAFGLFAIAIGVVECRRCWQYHRDQHWRVAADRLGRSAAIFLPPTLLFLIVSPSSGLPSAMHFNFTPFHKLAPLTRLLSSGNAAADVLVLAGLLLLFGYLLRTRRIAIDGALGLVAASFLLALLLLPYSAMESFFVDSRVAIAAALVFVVSLRSNPQNHSPQQSPRLPGASVQAVGLIVLVSLTGFRSAALVSQWHAWDDEFQEVLAAFDALPRGSVLVASTAAPFEYATTWFSTRLSNPPHEHTASYATIRREAIVPGIFAKRGQNPLVLTPRAPTVGSIALGPIPRAGPDAFRRMAAYRASAVRVELDARDGTDQPVFLVAFGVPCGSWAEALPVTPVFCNDRVSLVEAGGQDMSTMALLATSNASADP